VKNREWDEVEENLDNFAETGCLQLLEILDMLVNLLEFSCAS